MNSTAHKFETVIRGGSSGATFDPSRWLPLQEAADTLGRNAGALARECRESLQRIGMARKTGRKWQINREYDRRLWAGKSGADHQAADLSHLADDQREKTYQRARCVDQFRQMRQGSNLTDARLRQSLVPQLQQQYPQLRISDRSLQRWARDYKYPADIVKLADTRGGNNRGPADPTCWTFFEKIFLTESAHSRRYCWEQTKAHADQETLNWLTLGACLRQIDKKYPPELQTARRHPRDYKRAMQPYIEQCPDKWEAGVCYEGDHRLSNVVVRDDEGNLFRPWLTAWIDIRSRRVTGWALNPTPNSTTILAALRHALTDDANMGGPDTVILDNGKDYSASTFHGDTRRERHRKIRLGLERDADKGLFGMLGIEVRFTECYSPNGKPHIERWFDTLEELDKSLPTYTGRSPQTKPERLAGILNNKPHLIPTFDHYRERMENYIAGYNAQTGMDRNSRHMRKVLDGLSPNDYLTQHCPRRRAMADPKALDMLLVRWEKPTRVHRNGVSVKIGGTTFQYGQFDPVLSMLKPGKGKKGQEVRIAYDDADISRVRVHRMDGSFLCDVPANTRITAGTPAETVKEVIRKKRAYRKSRDLTAKGSYHEYLTTAELVAKQQVDKKKSTVKPPLKIVETPLDGSADALENQTIEPIDDDVDDRFDDLVFDPSQLAEVDDEDTYDFDDFFASYNQTSAPITDDDDDLLENIA